ncbi:hypothetical protein RIF29_22091 [Crotalaria pallida]|uniref:Uncharacterized protein n=1 Tax=Crotalaria pallida TaxID=3830 RepID=A0AAN9IE42_CROPI
MRKTKSTRAANQREEQDEESRTKIGQRERRRVAEKAEEWKIEEERRRYSVCKAKQSCDGGRRRVRAEMRMNKVKSERRRVTAATAATAAVKRMVRLRANRRIGCA